MLQPADVLFLDEPTNDLDISTLEVMEESFKEFGGAVVLISHDRYWMDRVCTQIVALGETETPPFFADYKQWEAASSLAVSTKSASASPQTKSPANKSTIKKLTYHEEKEWAEMESRILKEEAHMATLHKSLEAQSDAPKALELYRELAETEKRLEACFTRWEFLEGKRHST
jgi:ATP-binding cassette subfamily F protein uup